MAKRKLAGQPENAERPPAGAPEAGEAESENPPSAETAEEAAERVDGDLDALAEVQRERDEYLELAQRTRADFDNYRKRVAGETAAAHTRGKTELLRGLIPAIDNLERALRSAGVDPDAEAAANAGGESEEVSARDALAQGLALVYRELAESLGRAGVESYDPAGERFDPTLHEALSTRSDEQAKPGTVLETLDRGYRLDGQVLRPARVVVSD